MERIQSISIGEVLLLVRYATCFFINKSKVDMQTFYFSNYVYRIKVFLKYLILIIHIVINVLTQLYSFCTTNIIKQLKSKCELAFPRKKTPINSLFRSDSFELLHAFLIVGTLSKTQNSYFSMKIYMVLGAQDSP